MGNLKLHVEQWEDDTTCPTVGLHSSWHLLASLWVACYKVALLMLSCAHSFRRNLNHIT